MEAMTQKIMLHRRPHVEIWSAREGSDDDTSKIHLSHKTLTDPKQCQQKNKGSTSETKLCCTPTSQTMVHFRYLNLRKKTTTIRPPPSSTSETKIWQSSTLTNRMSIWSTSETQHLRIRTRHEPNTGVLPWIRLHILSGIGGNSQILTARILRRQKSRCRIGKP